MLDITKLLEELKASPYEEQTIHTPHTGVVSFPELKPGDSVAGVTGAYKEKPGTTLAYIERERNKKPINAHESGEIVSLNTELEGQFVEAGQPIATLRHYLSKDEVISIILKQTLYLFPAPERAKYYFTPDIDQKVKASGASAVTVRPGMELLIMSRMKRESPVFYEGPEGVIYAVYFQPNENVDIGDPLFGVCPPDQLSQIEDVVVRVQTEWVERQ